MDQAAKGKKALADGKYDEAITQYTAALKVSPTSPDYLVQRATAHQRAKQYAEALADANNAVVNAQKRAKRELIVEAQFRRGCALYSLERYGDAEFVFGVVKRMDEKHKMVPTWQQKTKTSLEKLDAEDEKRKATVEEMPDIEETSSVGVNGSSNASNGTSKDKAAATTEGTSAPTVTQQTPADKIRHDWYQNTESVFFTLLAKGVPEDKAQIDIQERSLGISFPLTTGSSYDFTLEPLFGAVKPKSCTTRILKTKVEITLAKATPGQKWSALESNEAIVAPTGTSDGKSNEVKQAVLADTKPTGPAYPTSSKSGPKDWDKIMKEQRKADRASEGKDKDDKDSPMDDDDDDDRGGDEANFFFKKLFKGSSPDVQRAMMKSYTESNGTALSTNWEEVSKGPVETSPPDGMEAKTW